MQTFSFEKTEIEGLTIINPFYCDDNRGWFSKNYEKDIFKKAGLDTNIQEVFVSSSKKGVVRGMHFQTKEPQSKIITALAGEIFDVAVDLRKDSKTYGKWLGVKLSAENMKSLYVPAGCAHGFMALSDKAMVAYKCTGRYLKDYDTGIRWNDKDIAINWPIDLVDEVIISDRDNALQSFKEYEKNWIN